MTIGHVLKSMAFLISINRRGGIIQRTIAQCQLSRKTASNLNLFRLFRLAPNLIYKLHISGKYLVVFHALYPQQGQVNCITSYVTIKRRVSLKFVEPNNTTKKPDIKQCLTPYVYSLLNHRIILKKMNWNWLGD